MVAGVALLAAACTAGARDQPPPRDGRSGLQGSGTIDGRQVAVGRGLPELVVGDCDPADGRDDDVCIITDTIDGRLLVLTIENPAVLVEGETLPVVDVPCATSQACDAVTEGVVVSVKLDTDAPVRATGGTLRLDRVEPFRNYAGAVSLQLPDGSFTGDFDVVPRPDS